MHLYASKAKSFSEKVCYQPSLVMKNMKIDKGGIFRQEKQIKSSKVCSKKNFLTGFLILYYNKHFRVAPKVNRYNNPLDMYLVTSLSRLVYEIWQTNTHVCLLYTSDAADD